MMTKSEHDAVEAAGAALAKGSDELAKALKPELHAVLAFHIANALFSRLNNLPTPDFATDADRLFGAIRTLDATIQDCTRQILDKIDGLSR